MIKVTKKVIDNLEPAVYKAVLYSGKTIDINLIDYWDSNGCLKECYYINFIEDHVEYLEKI